MSTTDRLVIQDGKVVYMREAEAVWMLELDKIKFVGEYTTAGGPYVDDWFFVFADKVDDWWQASTLVIDHEQFWNELSKVIDSQVAPTLFYSTKWASNVMYPKQLEGQELFVVVPANAKPKSFWQKLFGSDNDKRLELTDNVKQLFK